MIRPSSLAFPNSKTLAAWSGQLAPFEPAQVWVGYLFFHRVEALFEILRHEPLDPLSRLLLDAFALEDPAEKPLQRVAAHLSLPTQVVAHLVGRLREKGLVDDKYALTQEGREACSTGMLPRPTWNRRMVNFVERFSQPPHLCPLKAGPGTIWQPETSLNATHLQSAQSQAPEWKRRFGWPEDIRALVDGQTPGSHPPVWQRVFVDRPERWLTALIERPNHHVLGFPGKIEGWALEGQDPILDLDEEGTTILKDLLPDASLAAWEIAWQVWARERGLPTGEVQECRVELRGLTLHVEASPAIQRRLQLSRPDVFEGKTWLLQGDGFLRAARQLAISNGERGV